MDSTYETSRDWETTYSVRDLETRVRRLETREEALESRHEEMIRRVKAEMWAEIWMERLKAATIVTVAIAIIVWARLILGIAR